MSSMEATKKKMREAHFYLLKLEQEQAAIWRPEPEASDFYLSAFLSAARSVGDTIVAEEGEPYLEWYRVRRPNLTPEEDQLLRFTATQRVQTVHVRGADVLQNIKQVPLHELQRELEAKGGRIDVWGPPGTPQPQVPKYTLEFAAHPGIQATRICRQYLQLMERLLAEYEGRVVA